MKNVVFWLKRKKASLCILIGICSFSLFVIINSNEKNNENTGGSFVVKIKHYGLDISEIERSITIPLEDALSAIPGIMAVQSSSENSLSRVYVRFPGGRGRYEAVCDAAQRVYENLPSSAQRPEIFSSANSMVPVWSAAVFSSGFDDVKENILTVQMLEKIVKPRLESLEGAGEIMVYGVGQKEIVIVLDQEKLASLDLEPSMIAEVLGMNDSIFSGGIIVQNKREIIITVDGRYAQPGIYGSRDKPSLEKALIPLGEGKIVELSEIALITEQERTPDIISRLNGRKAAVISIMGRHEADLRKLSRDIKKELSTLSLPLEFTVLSDLGAEEAAAFRSVFNAAMLGAIMVAVISFLLGGNKSGNYSGFFCALAIPVICLLSAAILSMCGFRINRTVLAGIAAGVGTAVDAVILCSEKLRKCSDYGRASESLSELSGPLIAGAATTVVALVPLSSIKDGETGIIAAGIAAVTLTALCISLSLLPPLLLWGMNSREHSLLKVLESFRCTHKHVSRLMHRFLAADVKFCIRYPIQIASSAILITAAAVIALFAKGVDTGRHGSENSVYAQVEFDGGLLAEEADRLLAEYSVKLAGCKGIKNVETGARTGSGSLLVSFDPVQTKTHLVRDMARQIPIPSGFLFFHENTNKDRYWEIRISGDEESKCREIANELAQICAGHPLIRELVLNFKQGSKKLILQPDRDLFAKAFAKSNAGFSSAASTVRMGVYGPVAYKRVDSKGETDVRIRTGSGNDLLKNVMRKTKDELMNILVSAGNSENMFSLPIDSIVKTIEEIEPASIRRVDRRRTASITITTAPKDPRRIKHELTGIFRKLELPPGYSIEFDPDAIQAAQALSRTVISLIMAIIFCYMIIASINESFTVPLLVLSAVPPSLAIPALCMVFSGSAYNSAIACSFIAVSGMTINAAVLCTDGLRASFKTENVKMAAVYSALRRKMPALLATTGTTVAGAFPFLFLREGANTLIRTLSLVGGLGVICSCICSITIIPSLFWFFAIDRNLRGKIEFRLCGKNSFSMKNKD
ncbi:MAG: efflux RND transporter permease subunit [Treponema sp.]|jgi:multidrug efflux pump subunit AcrB|nr:efflux RND transporter permease subunit [Treponema sp.]